MPRVPRPFAAGCLVLFVSLHHACAQAPPAEQAEHLQQRLGTLNEQLAALPNEMKRTTSYIDAAVCAKAAEWILRHGEFYRPNYVQSVHKVLDLGLQRVEGIRSGTASWGVTPGGWALGYRSRVDRSLQPIAVTLPRDFDADSPKRWPLYVVLHGRNATLTEASFMASIEGKQAPEDQHWIQLDVFGRTNNAYRWAGETDVFEAMEAVQRRYRIDPARVTLWGFSMGGAGAWHLGLHHPCRWASVGAGAGFVDFYKYQKRSEPLSEPQHQLLGIYDSVDYALNLANVPFITYGGEEDPQLLASLTMKQLADDAAVPLQVLVGPKMGHKFDDASKAAFMKFLGEHNAKGRAAHPGNRELRFVTRTLKYNQCDWLRIEEQLEPFASSRVESRLTADGTLILTTANVRALAIDRAAADRVRLDGEGEVVLSNAADGLLPDVYFLRDEGKWMLLGYEDSLAFQENREVRKRHNLQGPIDDAFMEPFLCVRGTGEAWSGGLQAYAEWTLDRFASEFDKYLRGQVPIKRDVAVNEQDIASRNLILFGDPGSNAVLARVLEGLPVRWTRTGIEIAGKEYDPASHAVVLIYPNPLNPRRYVVVNTGMTMRAGDFRASNAWLFPKLGDVGVIQFSRDDAGAFNEQVLWSEMFDGAWQLSAQ